LNIFTAKKDSLRPTTAGIVSQFGQSEAPTAISNNLGPSNSESEIATAIKGRELSVKRFLRFEETEKCVEKQPYKAFYTSNEPTIYHKENRFEGRSNYMFYYPTGETYEQELEQFWWDAKNKELADKRRDEEEQ
jgi:hypothetical protein